MDRPSPSLGHSRTLMALNKGVQEASISIESREWATVPAQFQLRTKSPQGLSPPGENTSLEQSSARSLCSLPHQILQLLLNDLCGLLRTRVVVACDEPSGGFNSALQPQAIHSNSVFSRGEYLEHSFHVQR